MSKLCLQVGAVGNILLTTEDTGEHSGRMSAVFAIEQIAHGFAASGVSAFVGLPSFGGFRSGIGGVFFAAFGAAVGKTWLAGFQFEFFAANYANFNRIWHVHSTAS